MPNLFSRRRGNSVTPPVDRNTSAAAATAASQAFRTRSSSVGPLSSAAAAAALRSHVTTPEPVGNLQTKRMIRRGSNSSATSASVIGSSTRGGVGRGGLQRTNSNGSMTERTFRSPSPGGRNGSVSAAPDAPPVPSVPVSMRGSHTRSASQEPPQRMMSPTPRGSARGVSVDRGSAATPMSSRKKPARLSNVQEVDDSSPSSVNFSRPRSTQGSPTTARHPPVHSSGSWFTQAGGSQDLSSMKPTTRAAASQTLRSGEVSGIQANLSATANQPTKKNQIARGAQGSHLAQASNSSSGLTGSAMDTADTIMVYDSASRTFVSKPRPSDYQPPRAQSPIAPAPQVSALKPGTYDPSTRSIVPTPTPTPTPAPANSSNTIQPKKTRPVPSAVDTSLTPPPRNPARVSPSASPVSPRAAGYLQKQPSVVREDPDAETAAEKSTPYTPHSRSASGTVQTSVGPVKRYIAPQAPAPNASDRSVSLDVPRSGSESSGRGRGNSLSPSRSAHFSSTPVVEGTKHVPHRGVSPVKSAMKHSPASSLRTESPVHGASPAGGRAWSESSTSPSRTAQDGSVTKKKKSVRVSFDEKPHELGPMVGPVAPSSINRERSPAVDDDMEELMGPRPALPSFGSVRKNRAQQPDVAEKVTERPPARHEASNDHVVGAILANDAANKNASNEPIPPEVTSKEGPTYASDTSDDEATPLPKPNTLPVVPVVASAPVTRDFAPPPALSSTSPTELHVPDISLQPPTPNPEDEQKKLGGLSPPATPKPKSSWEGFAVPGSWGKDVDDDPPAPTTMEKVAAPITQAASAVRTTAEDVVARVMGAPTSTSAPVSTPSIPERADEHTLNNANLSDINETDSDDSAAFSDAAEDLSDNEGGFASLNALVSSPALPSPSQAKSISTPPDSPSVRLAAKQSAQEGQHEQEGSGDWTNATAYWSQLSRQQREQIEREHFSSDDEKTPPKAATQKPKKKKSALKQTTPVAPIESEDETTPQRAAPAPQQTQPAPVLRKSMRAQPGPQPAAADGAVHMRSSMRTQAGPQPAAADGAVQMRSSMRSGGPGPSGASTMRTSMRGPPPQRPQSEYVSSNTAPPRTDTRPMSSGGPPAQSRALQAGPFPVMGNNNAAKPPLPGSRLSKQQPVNNDSDSESSFRKKRRPSASTVDTAGKYSMKRSMRSGSIDSEQARPTSPTPANKGTFSVRSLSPTGSFFGRNRQNLKESMRASPADSGVKTLRGPAAMGKKPPKPAARATTSRPATLSGGMASRFKSRFADSDDEDDGGRGAGGRPMFRSRFADSDDDEPGSPGIIAADLTPVRGIPRRKGQEDGDSTDLSDDSDDPRKASRRRNKQVAPIVPNPVDIEKAMEAARRNLGMTKGASSTPALAATPNTEGGALSKGSLRQPAEAAPTTSAPASPAVTPAAVEQKQKRGFMGSILRRNRNSSMSVQQVTAPSTPLAAGSPAQAFPQQEAPPTPSIPATPTRGKLIRRSSNQPKLTRGDSNFSTMTAPATTSTPKPGDENWPLPPVPKINANGSVVAAGAEEERPNTSDGIHEQAVRLAQTMRPDMGRRSASGMSPPSVGFAGDVVDSKERRGIYSEKTGRKKKFGMLRRAFGLND